MSGPPPSTPEEHAALEALVEALEWQARGPYTVAEIAARLGRQSVQIDRIEQRALSKLRRLLEADGISAEDCAEEPARPWPLRALPVDGGSSHDLHGQIRKKLF